MARLLPRLRRKQKRNGSSVGVVLPDWWEEAIACGEYISLDQNPEIMTACHKIAELIGSMTIHLMSNEADGDIRIVNELSRVIDINPEPHMTRKTWMESIVMNMLLYGKGNAVVVPHTWKGYLQSMEPIAANRVSFLPVGNRDYKVLIDGVAKSPDSLLHFVHNPDKNYLWKGRGITTNLRDIANNLKQAAATEKGFMESKWKPSIIVKVDGMTEEFASPAGRKKLLESYVESSEVGEPWLIPADQFEVEQVRPLSLADLAISSTVELDKRTVAAIIGVPPFVLGVGEYNQAAWNNFIQNTIRPIVITIQQEMTKKLITSTKWYIRFNIWSLLDYDIEKVSAVLLAGSDRGFVNGDEWRDRMNLEPAGLKEYRVLENYIPWEMSGQQSKLKGAADE